MLARRIRSLVVLGFVGWLTGCGGGGGGNEPVAEVSPIAITAQPASQRVTAPDAASFVVTASDPAVTYQWQLCSDTNTPCGSWSDIADAVSASYSTGATDATMTGRRYRVRAGNSADSVVSGIATMTVDPTPAAPAITAQPVDASVVAPSAASFTVAYSGVPAPAPSWQYSNDGSTWFDLGVSGPTYSTGPTSTSDNGRRLRVIISSSAGSVTSNAVTVTVIAAATAPTIATQPANQTVSAPAVAIFSVNASGTPTPTLQWQLSLDAGGHWADILGATAASYSTPATVVGNTGSQYRAVATNRAGAAVSNPAGLTVNAPPPPAGGWQVAGLIESEDLGDASRPQVAINAGGDGMAVWSQFDGTRNNIWANRYLATTGWGIATLIESDAGDAVVPQIVVDASGNATAVWQQRDANGRNNIVAIRYLVGVGWGTPAGIETKGPSAGDDQLPRIAMDASGNVIVAWERNAFSSTSIWANRYVPGTGWGTATQIGNGNPNVNHVTPQVTMDAAGNAFAVWVQYNGRITNVWGSRFVVGTGWGTAGLIQDDSASAGRDPMVAADASGNALLVWAQFDVTTSADHIWASRYVVGTGWGTSTLLQTSNPTQEANLPRVAFDASGNAMAVWNQGAFGLFSIYAARYSTGAGWATPALIETHASGSSAANAAIGMDAGGDAIVVWQLQDASLFTDTWANRYAAGTGWGTVTQVEPANARTGQAVLPVVAVNTSGKALVAWQRRNPTRFDIWANAFK
jgi:hypothetical protein